MSRSPCRIRSPRTSLIRLWWNNSSFTLIGWKPCIAPTPKEVSDDRRSSLVAAWRSGHKKESKYFITVLLVVSLRCLIPLLRRGNSHASGSPAVHLWVLHNLSVEEMWDQAIENKLECMRYKVMCSFFPVPRTWFTPLRADFAAEEQFHVLTSSLKWRNRLKQGQKCPLPSTDILVWVLWELPLRPYFHGRSILPRIWSSFATTCSPVALSGVQQAHCNRR